MMDTTEWRTKFVEKKLTYKIGEMANQSMHSRENMKNKKL